MSRTRNQLDKRREAIKQEIEENGQDATEAQLFELRMIDEEEKRLDAELLHG